MFFPASCPTEGRLLVTPLRMGIFKVTSCSNTFHLSPFVLGWCYLLAWRRNYGVTQIMSWIIKKIQMLKNRNLGKVAKATVIRIQDAYLINSSFLVFSRSLISKLIAKQSDWTWHEEWKKLASFACNFYRIERKAPYSGKPTYHIDQMNSQSI